MSDETPPTPRAATPEAADAPAASPPPPMDIQSPAADTQPPLTRSRSAPALSALQDESPSVPISPIHVEAAAGEAEPQPQQQQRPRSPPPLKLERTASFTPGSPEALARYASLRSAVRRDPNLKLFLPAEALALKAILSPPVGRAFEPFEGSLGMRKSSSSTAVAPSNSSNNSNLIDKLLFRSPPTPTPAKTSAGSLVEEDLDRVNSSVVVMNTALPPPPFANMFACDSCREDIGSLLGKGRHHCRNCGGSFCGDCSAKTIVVPYQAYLDRGELRVCDACFHRIQNFQAQVQSASVTWGGLPPPATADLQRAFELAEDEQPVTIFNCALFMDITPYYGHLVLTRTHFCFRGYSQHRLKVPFERIVSLVKPQFYYINGLQVKTDRKEKFFLAEFNGLRDMCFLRMDQLIRAWQEGNSRKQDEAPLSAQDLLQQAMVRRKSYRLLAERVAAAPPPASTSSAFLLREVPETQPPLETADVVNFASQQSSVGFFDIDDDENSSEPLSETERGSEDGKSTTSDEETFVPLPPDAALQNTTILLDCDLRADVKAVFDLLWNDEIGRQFTVANLEKARDIDIAVDKWQPIDAANRAALAKGFTVCQEQDYAMFRHVRSQHPPKTSFPGLPAYADCVHTQRFRLDKSSQGGDKWDRFVVSDLMRMSKIPFSDYFEIETRWVFSRDGKNYCHVQAGLVVNFLKATWFKSQINSSTKSESKEALENWAKQALEHLGVHAEAVAAAASPCRGSSSRIKSQKAPRDQKEAEVSPPPCPSLAPISRAWTAAQQPSAATVATVSSGEAAAFEFGGLAAYLPWVVLVLLLYCLMVIRSQQHQIQQLATTTTMLLERLQTTSSSSLRSSNLEDVCQQRIMDGAMEALEQFFHAAGQ